MILVTGGTGLVGSHLLFRLAQGAIPVRAIKRTSSNTELVKKIFGYYAAEGEKLFSKIEWVEGDVTDIFSLEDALEGVEKVYHCAAIVSFDPRDQAKMEKTNAEGTANVVNACLDAKVKKLCYVSSVAALGRTRDNSELIDENTQWKTSPENSFYAITKYNAEREVWRGAEEGLDVVMVNPCVIIGPSDWNVSSSMMFRVAYNGLKIYAEGSNAFVDVRDVAECMEKLMESEIKSERFLTTSENLPFKKVFDTVLREFGKKETRIKVRPWMSAVGWRVEKWKTKVFGGQPRITRETAMAAHQHYCYSSEKIKNRLGHQFIPVEEAVKNACGFYKQK